MKVRFRKILAVPVAIVCVLAAYYAGEWMQDRRGLVGEILAAPGEPTAGTSIDVAHVVRPHVWIGLDRPEAVQALERGGFDVEVYTPDRYEWLHLTCPDCDEGVWGRYDQSILRGGERITIGLGVRNGRVVHMEAHRVMREFSI